MKLDPKALEAAADVLAARVIDNRVNLERMARQCVTAYLSTIAETHMVVPKEPTEEMLDAGWEEVNKQGIGADGRHHFAPVYAAMIAASQQGGE